MPKKAVFIIPYGAKALLELFCL